MINSNDTYKVFSDFYDIYVGKFSDDLDFYKTYCNKTDQIIEIGCGTGRILDYLLNLDFNVVGVDVSQEMLDKAHDKLNLWIDKGSLRLYNHDYTFSRFNQYFDKALLTFYTFNYVIDKPLDFLTNVYDSLNNNGLLLIDLFYPTTYFDKSLDNNWIQKDYEINGHKILIEDNRHVIDNIERRQQVFNIGDDKMHIDTDRKYFSPIEIKELLEKAGFKEILLSLDYNHLGFQSMIDENKLKRNFIIKAKK